MTLFPPCKNYNNNYNPTQIKLLHTLQKPFFYFSFFSLVHLEHLHLYPGSQKKRYCRATLEGWNSTGRFLGFSTQIGTHMLPQIFIREFGVFLKSTIINYKLYINDQNVTFMKHHHYKISITMILIYHHNKTMIFSKMLSIGLILGVGAAPNVRSLCWMSIPKLLNYLVKITNSSHSLPLSLLR